jgi:hypothetical protein
VERRLELMQSTVPIQWTNVTFPAKALKLIVVELQNQLGNAPAIKSRTEEVDVGSDDDVRLHLLVAVMGVTQAR